MNEDVRKNATLTEFTLPPEKNVHLPSVWSINKFNGLNKDFKFMKNQTCILLKFHAILKCTEYYSEYIEHTTWSVLCI